MPVLHRAFNSTISAHTVHIITVWSPHNMGFTNISVQQSEIMFCVPQVTGSCLDQDPIYSD
jgi:hypothetical protein